MTQTSPISLPRPEDRRRGELERLVGCQGAGLHWRSEGFAEDVAVAPQGAGLSKALTEAGARRAPRPLLWTDRLGLWRG